MRFFLVIAGLLAICLNSGNLQATEAGCPAGTHKDKPSLEQSAVYQDTPFQEGEKAAYKVHYMGILVGYGYLQVNPPVSYQSEWLQHFTAWASTGDWYSAFFVAKDRVMAYSRPGTFAVRKFYLKQDEGKLFGDRLIQEKWLNFQQGACKVDEIIQKKGKAVVREEAELVRDSMDALGVVFRLRSLIFEVGKVQRLPVYSSKKNWWLEAHPLKEEEVSVPAGTFKAVVLKLQTFLGKDLQQKGDVYAWIAKDHPARPLVKVEGEIKIGSVKMELESFTVEVKKLAEKEKGISPGWQEPSEDSGHDAVIKSPADNTNSLRK